jgi:hypothetical protein
MTQLPNRPFYLDNKAQGRQVGVSLIAASHRAFLAVVLAWAAIHLAFADQFIFHDSWKHNFPMLYRIARVSGCGMPPAWLWSPDSGTPTIIYVVSTSLTQILRVPTLLALGCLHLGLDAAVYYQKLVIYLGYLAVALGMYVLGRFLFIRTLSAVYLFAATLFAGLSIEAAHSDQVVTITFWWPWIAICGVLYHRHYAKRTASRYLNLATVFVCLGSFDQYPHFQAVAVGSAAVIYAALERRRAAAALARHGPRLWPSVLALTLTLLHFLLFQSSVRDYVPSLRGSLVVNPATFADVGFAEPTAFIGSLLPLTFLAHFDTLRVSMEAFLKFFPRTAGSQWFVFKLDEVAFYIGVIPVGLAAVFLARPGMGRLRLGWALWTAVILAVSLRQSGLYQLLFHLPYFDIFRSYLLFILFVVLGLLVMSAYGLDALLSLQDEARRLAVRRALLALVVLVLGASIGLATILLFYHEPMRLLASLETPLSVDLFVIAAAFAALVYAGSSSASPGRRAAVIITAMVVFQMVYAAGTYGQLGTSQPQLMGEFGLDRLDLQALDAATADDPSRIQRKLCVIYAECYLSQRATVSLRRDLDGTFLRSKREPVFAPGLHLPVVFALSGLTMPVFWVSSHVEAIDSDAALVGELNAHDSDIAQYLRNVAHVDKDGMARLGADTGARDGWASEADLTALRWKRNRVRLDYRAERPVLLNSAIACTPRWKASVNGEPVPLVCANFGGMLMRLAPGGGTLELSYADPWSELIFATRYFLDLVGLIGIVLLARKSLRTEPPAASTYANACTEKGGNCC